MLKHNKKRNVGLIYEFFSRYIGQALLENRDSDMEKAKSILFKHFAPGTDLHKEFRLFKTLFEANLNSKEVAMNLLNRVREAVKFQSQTRLDLEKTSLIHEVNTKLNIKNGDSFFNVNVPNYKVYATIQVLLNSWREEPVLKENFDYNKVLLLEEKLISHLIENKEQNIDYDFINKMKVDDVNILVVDLMYKKFNSKFSNSLTEDQKEIVKLYTFANKDDEAKQKLVNKLTTLKETVLMNIDSKKDIKILSEVKETLLDKNVNDISHDNITFYLSICKLKDDLASEE